MKIRMVVITMMILLSMTMMGAAAKETETGTFEVADTVGDAILDVIVDYDAQVFPGCYGTTHYRNGEYAITGEITRGGDIYTAEFDATGYIKMHGEDIEKVDITVDGKIYQSTETDTNNYYEYSEDGYHVGGNIAYTYYYYWSDELEHDLDFEEYSIHEHYLKPQEESTRTNTMSSPGLGLNWQGSVAGDQIPQLYTWAEKDNKYKHHTTDYYPHPGTCAGVVTITPARIAGEPIEPTGYWDTPRGRKVLQWKSSS